MDEFGGLRATTPEAKKRVCSMIAEAWCRVPSLRLGQFIVGVVGGDPYYIEDFDLVARLVEFAVKSDTALDEEWNALERASDEDFINFEKGL